MKNSTFNNFIHLFDLLHPVSEIISNKNVNELYKQMVDSKINDFLIKLHPINNPVNNTLEELEDELNNSHNTEGYILRKLRKLEKISTLLEIGLKKEYCMFGDLPSLKIAETHYFNAHITIHKLLERYCNWTKPELKFELANNYETYIIKCFRSYQSFIKKFDILCMDFNIDIEVLQGKYDLIIIRRSNAELLFSGHKKTLSSNKELQGLEKIHKTFENKSGQNNTKRNKDQKTENEKIKDLFSCFESPTKYIKVMNILADKELIHPNTYIWKDKKAANKKLLIALLKDMEGKQYFKPEINLNWELCRIIVENPFRLPVKSNKTFYDATLQPDLKDLIPYASTME